MPAFDPASVFQALKSLLLPYAPHLKTIHDTPDNFYLDTHLEMKKGYPLFFAATKVQKSYVSFYFFPVYTHPQLLEGISPALKGRMQGKSCFNFKTADGDLLAELSDLITRGAQTYAAEGKLAPEAVGQTA